MAYVIKTEDHSVPGFRWVSLKRLQYCDAKGHKRTWEMAERIQRRTPSEGPPPANGVGVVAIISTALEKDNDHIVLGKEGGMKGGGTEGGIFTRRSRHILHPLNHFLSSLPPSSLLPLPSSEQCLSSDHRWGMKC